ncbi:cell division protein ZapE [Legionella dresdenensis]|uniref:Cell division protein ZapE n=1 Tax=Legionella dresdenensis TaxID=450200 RepID=A0ABV8CF26_9GAMM
MTLFDQYDAAVANAEIENDPVQREQLSSLQRLAVQLTAPKKRWLPWLRQEEIKGVYLYGQVGVGKTFLMDLFFDYVAIEQKKRFHFHHFMQQIDARLRRLQGQKNPLQRIAEELAASTRLLCFDEFLVEDVAYAMILAELLQAIFDKGVVLVATSNTLPDNLYLKGVQRARFLPAIAAIKAHCEVLNLGEKRDYRLGREILLETYLTPLDEEAALTMDRQFVLVTKGEAVQHDGLITVQNREIVYNQCSGRSIWFEFTIICNKPRSQLDYLEIADRFDTVFVSNIPALGKNDTMAAILLIHFIDVMYDRGIRLVISAAVPVEELYTDGEMLQTFQRTYSRLKEMQSVDYQRRHPRRISQSL